MGEKQGLTNSQYAFWMNETAAQDCWEVSQIFIRYMDGTENVIPSNICSFMEDTDSSEIADFNEVKFSGSNAQGDWYAIDKRISANLERTVNYADVPINIRRPTGG